MKRFISGLIASVIAAVGLTLVAPPAGAADIGWRPTARQQAAADCTTFHITAQDETQGDVWKARLGFDSCEGSAHRWKVLHGYGRSITRDPNDDGKCVLFRIQSFRMNITPLGLTDPPPVTWKCHEGQMTYRSYHDLGDRVLAAGATDRCFNFLRRTVRGPISRDATGSSPKRCLS